MSLASKVRDDPQTAAFDILGKVRAGMLGVAGSSSHMQPMTHYADADASQVWFITSSDTDLAREIGLGARAHFCVVAPDDGAYACLSGHIAPVDDQAKLDELWSPVAAAWFEQGRDDPKVTLLRFSLDEAALWVNSANSLMFGLEILRSNLSAEHQPDVGEHVVVSFPAAA